MRPPHQSAVYVISVAASLCNTHPQTLRAYERLGFVAPARTKGGVRLYSITDVERLLRIVALSASGVSLPGIRHILHLEAELDQVRTELEALRQRVNEVE